MKKTLILALALALPLAQAVQADNNNSRKNRRASQSEEVRVPAAKAPAARTVQRPNVPRRTAQRSNPLYPPRRISTATRNANLSAGRSTNRAITNRTFSGNAGVNSGRFRNRDLENHTPATGNVVTQANRGNRNFDPNSFATARSRVIHTRHDRAWWRSHYHTIFVLFGGGYYYWDAGYWFPAYGYDPYYNNYAYDEPIYGYNDLAPGQVLENVQIALRDLGYYNGPIDGLIGPQTRAALGDYQEDNGLVVTEAVDEPTLVTLGLA